MCGRYALDSDIDVLINQYKAIIGIALIFGFTGVFL